MVSLPTIVKIDLIKKLCHFDTRKWIHGTLDVMGSFREDDFIKVLVERDTKGQYWWILTWDVQPVLQLSANIQCKRQGQAWGQEKSYYDNHQRSSGYVRIHEKGEKKHLEQLAEEEMPAGDKFAIDVIQYEKFPVLNRVPQVCTSPL